MVDVNTQNKTISVNVSSSGVSSNVNASGDTSHYYSEKAREWAISNRIVDNTDYSSKYYANESKKQADISTAKATEVIESGNNAISDIEMVRDNAIFDVNTAGATQVALATEQATIATNKASEVIESGNEALNNIDTAKDNAITSITNQETTSKTSLIDEGATQVGLIQNEGAKQVANVQSTGFYMRDDKLYFINSQGEETEFKLDDIELNNPYSLFDSKYSDHELNNLSWLKSEGQFNTKIVYPAYYDWLLKIYNGTETVEGVSVKLSTEEYTDYDFVLNSAEETFRLPLLDGSESLLSDKKENFSYTSSGMEYTAPANGWVVFGCVTGVNNAYLSLKNNTSGNIVIDHAPNPTDNLRCTCQAKKGDVITIKKTATGAVDIRYFIYAKGNGSLYYYVGETVQNANLINAGRIEEKLASLIPNNSSLIANYSMPDYENGITSDNVAMGTWVQVMKDSFVITYGGDPFYESYFIYVSPDKTTKYTVGHRMDDVNSNTQATTFAFFVPKGWYFQNNAEGGSSYHIYPLKGAN